jgi:hypothetical protein
MFLFVYSSSGHLAPESYIAGKMQFLESEDRVTRDLEERKHADTGDVFDWDDGVGFDISDAGFSV